jgi:PIN domain nuclease of toxin-antitoxin system
MTVFDASALVALLRKEAGSERAAEAFHEGVLCAVNLAEVLGRMARLGVAPSELLARLLAGPLTITAFSVDEALLATELLPRTRHRGLSLGDRACLATAVSRGLPVLTADRSWEGLEVGVPLEVIR